MSGTPTLRTPEGEHVLRQGDSSSFHAGPEGAHAGLERNGRPCSRPDDLDLAELELCVYPDSDKVGVWSRRSSS